MQQGTRISLALKGRPRLTSKHDGLTPFGSKIVAALPDSPLARSCTRSSTFESEGYDNRTPVSIMV